MTVATALAVAVAVAAALAVAVAPVPTFDCGLVPCLIAVAAMQLQL